MMYEEIVRMRPERTIHTYVRLVSLAIGLRKKFDDLPPDFRLCMPFEFVPEISRHFPEYAYSVLGYCFTKDTECQVRFSPLFLRA